MDISTTELTRRVKRIPGARNLRDLGGYPTADGRKVRWGVVYRAGTPAEIPEHAHSEIAALGLACIVDMRSNRERLHEGYHPKLLKDLEYWYREYDFSEGDMIEMLRNPASCAEDARRMMKQVYRDLPYEQTEALKALFAKVRAGRIPLLVNCSAGKDRTGTAAALLLSALGVPRETIVEDYALSERLHDPADSFLGIDPTGPLAFLVNVAPDVWRAVMGSPAEYLEEMFATLERKHGSVDNYCREMLGLDGAGLFDVRAALLEPAT